MSIADTLARLWAKVSGGDAGGGEAKRLIAMVREKNLTYCGYPKLENLAAWAERVRDERVPGVFLEAGVALGGSAIVLGHLKDKCTPLELYDVFGMIPPPGSEDGEDSHTRFEEIKSGASKGLGEDQYYGYVPELQTQVIKNLEEANLSLTEDHIRLVQGDFRETLWPSQVALAHIDCDWFDSVQTCIERIWPNLSPGGVIVFDDYSSYSGCRKAVDAFLQSQQGVEIVFQDRSIGLRKTA